MRKQWVALLSLLGLAGSTVPADAQIFMGKVAKAKQRAAKSTATQHAARQAKAATSRQKLHVNQRTLRHMNQAAGAAGRKGKAAYTPPPPGKAALTPPPPGMAARNKQLTKANNAQLTKANNAQLTKANRQLTKGNRQLTKSNRQLTKANRQLTKGNNALTKANKSQLTKAAPR